MPDVITIHGIKCDHCSWRDDTVQVDNYPNYIGRPCPICGHNLLTKRDYKRVKRLLKLNKWLSRFAPKAGETAITCHTEFYHHPHDTEPVTEPELIPTSIIFLDMDGILCHMHYDNEKRANIDPDCVTRLKKICNATGASVVIISSWRGDEHHTPHIYHTMRYILYQADIHVLDDAPHIPLKLQEGYSCTSEDELAKYIIPGTGRAEEVHQWLNQHPEVKHFVILDDSDYAWNQAGLGEYWVRPAYFAYGLEDKHMMEAIHILKTKERR